MAESSDTRAGRVNKKFAVFLVLWQAMNIVLYGTKVRYAPEATATHDNIPNPVTIRYAMYQDVHVMIFVGFGFLMTFLRKYSYSAVGYNFVIAAMALQWAVLVIGFWHGVADKSSEKIDINIDFLVNADFCAAAVLITFGGILGKTNAFQLIVLTFIEVIFYGLNEMILTKQLVIADLGGSMIIHTFGAYFGLTCALILGPRNQLSPQNHPDNSSNKTFDTTAMIGTLFLWLFWPSFNAAMAEDSRQHRAVINTVLSISASCVTAFAVSAMLRSRNKFSMVDVQNATLAGGVACGAIADMSINPWGALLTGSVTGIVSCFGFCVLQAFLAENIKLFDTCGIHNLHGMPGVIGGIASAIAAGAATKSTYGMASLGIIFPERAPSDTAEAALYGLDPGSDRSAMKQAGMQVIALLVTLGIAILSGAFTATLIKQPFFEPPSTLFDDKDYWQVEDEHDIELQPNPQLKQTGTSAVRLVST
eukprot:c11665_g1_i1.p1 GENE.c11665_g1_i1~~c11665_g1_i1.p1  ORF type:complete len:477 (+),score=144.21 c11665_g1_i1:354-1784(+)